ncbi:MAG: ethanolamine ammonia-lyase reactivating factor EutA, partial [Enterobacteriaceae bacterium]
YQVISGELTPLAQELMMTEPLPVGQPVGAVMISGGVGECLQRPVSVSERFRFQDIGPLLAAAIAQHGGFAALPVVSPRQTVRATVIGAGAHTLSLSGSTIWLKALSLPLRNIPVVHGVMTQDVMSSGELLRGWQQGLRQQDLQPQQDLYALALPDSIPVTYQAILHCVAELSEFVRLYPAHYPLLILASQDLGKALGMLLQPHVGQRVVAVIDEVATREGDYIDIGHALFGGEIVPITVKSLAFPS